MKETPTHVITEIGDLGIGVSPITESEKEELEKENTNNKED